MLKPWVHLQNNRLKLHDSEALGEWLAELSHAKWIEALDWLNKRMKKQATTKSSWNDHWNNHL